MGLRIVWMTEMFRYVKSGSKLLSISGIAILGSLDEGRWVSGKRDLIPSVTSPLIAAHVLRKKH